MSKLSQVFQRTAASLKQAERRAALEELRDDLADGPLSDDAIAIDEASETAAQNLAAVVQAVADASECETDARALRGVEEDTCAVRAAMEMVNANGGFTLESLGYAQRALRAALAPCQIMPPLSNLPALESFADGAKQTVSLEGIDELLTQIGAVKSEIETKSIDSILRVLDALKAAGPDVKDRLVAMQQALPDLTYDENAQIRVDDLIFKSLAVDGRLPTGFKDFAESYAEFVNTILSIYSENALVAAGKAGEIGSTLSGLAENACPIAALTDFVKSVGDPRDGIDADKLNYVLPGSGPLFGDAMQVPPDTAMGEEPDDAVDAEPATESNEDDPAGAELVSRLTKFCETRIPLDPVSWADRADVPADAATIRVLSKDTIAGAIAALIKSLDVVDPKTFGDTNRQTWVQARSAYAAYQQAKSQLQAAQAADLNAIDQPLCCYLDTVFELAAWPALHVLTNVVFTANAFLLLAERSIAGETEQSAEEEGAAIPDDVQPEDDSVVVEDEVVDPANDGTDPITPASDATAAMTGDDVVATATDATEEPASDAVEPTAAVAEPVAEPSVAEPGEPTADEPEVEPAAPVTEEPAATAEPVEPAAVEEPAAEPVTEPAVPASEPVEPVVEPAAEPAAVPAKPEEKEEEEDEQSASTGDNA